MRPSGIFRGSCSDEQLIRPQRGSCIDKVSRLVSHNSMGRFFRTAHLERNAADCVSRISAAAKQQCEDGESRRYDHRISESFASYSNANPTFPQRRIVSAIPCGVCLFRSTKRAGQIATPATCLHLLYQSGIGMDVVSHEFLTMGVSATSSKYH